MAALHFFLGYVVLVVTLCATYVVIKGGWSLVTERETYTPKELRTYWLIVLVLTALALPLWGVIGQWIYRQVA